MVVFSRFCRQICLVGSRFRGQICQPKSNSLVALRLMSSGRTMQIRPSRHEINIWKDKVHFYFLLGAIPLGCFIVYMNVFVGPATLSDIPEGYEPKYWEYHGHPIRRFFAEYIYRNPQKDYEKYLHCMYVEDKKAKWRKREWKAKQLMKERADYKSWYYVPVNDRHIYLANENIKDMEETRGISATRVD